MSLRLRAFGAGRARVPFAIALAVSLLLPAQAALPIAPDSPTVTTLAGSGGMGITDGPALSATFISPAGLSYDREGNLYIADRAAQRIRKLSRAGVVTTIAGAGKMIALGLGAEGGYRDGPAAQALFNMPEDVLALPDGSVLVADTKNVCLRLIRGGMVSTYAGMPGQAHGPDGPRQSARFNRPLSLASDGAGNVYVADPPNGVRAIDRAGNVTTLHFPDSAYVTGLSGVPGDTHHLLLILAAKIERLDLTTLAVDRVFPLSFSFPVAVNREGQTSAGPASAVAAFAGDDFVWTDPLQSAVRLGQTAAESGGAVNYTRPLTMVPREDASLGFAGFRDGLGTQAEVDEPMGVAVAPDGSVTVADTGNRRIRRLANFNRFTHLIVDDAQAELPKSPDPKEFRIALVGSSYVWYDQAWHDSVPGITEDLLRAGMPPAARRPHIYPIMRFNANAAGSLDIIDDELSDSGLFDMIVLDWTAFGIGGDGQDESLYPAGWQANLTTRFARTLDELRRAHVAFLVLDHPAPADFPSEMAYKLLPKGGTLDDTPPRTELQHVQNYHDDMRKVLDTAGVPTLDVWPDFLREYASPDRLPLFNVWDHHFSQEGRHIVGTALARRILALQPWNASR
jgi:hypothetical protein